MFFLVLHKAPALYYFMISSLIFRIHSGLSLQSFYLIGFSPDLSGNRYTITFSSNPSISTYDHGNTSKYPLKKLMSSDHIFDGKLVPI